MSPLNSIWTEWSTILVGSSPSERNRVCVEALLVVWSDLSERARKVWLTFVYLWKSLWVTLIAIGFVLVFKAQLSGAKFYENRPARRDHFSILRGSTFGSLVKYICFAQGSKTGPQHSEPGASLGACLTPHSNTLLRRVVGIRPQTSASHITATTSWQPGRRPPPCLQKVCWFQMHKNEPSRHGEVLLLKCQKDQQMWEHG